jgi:uncharacterized protein
VAPSDTRPPLPPFTLDSGHGYRSHGNENWEFNAAGFMQRRFAGIKDLPIAASARMFHGPLGRRPGDHPDLSEPG